MIGVMIIYNNIMNCKIGGWGKNWTVVQKCAVGSGQNSKDDAWLLRATLCKDCVTL